MTRVVRLIIGLCILAAAASDASAAPQRAPKPAASAQTQAAHPGAKSVCVASAIGHRFDIQTVGVMVFGNSLLTAAIDPWRIDEFAANKAASLLKGMTVRRINLSRASLVAYETSQPGDFFARDRNEEFMSALRAAASAAPKCDFYLVIVRIASGYSNTNQHLTGLNILKHASAFAARQWVFASIGAMLYDGNFERIHKPITGNELGQALVSGFTGPGIHAPYQEVDQSNWPASPQAALQSAALREATKHAVEQAVTKYVPRLFSSE